MNYSNLEMSQTIEKINKSSLKFTTFPENVTHLCYKKT